MCASGSPPRVVSRSGPSLGSRRNSRPAPSAPDSRRRRGMRCRRTRATDSPRPGLRSRPRRLAALPRLLRAAGGARPRGHASPVISPSTTRAGRSGPRTRSVQPSPGCTRPSGSATDSRRARHCRADGDHTAACSSGRGNKSRGGRRDAVPLGCGWFVGLLRGDTRVQRDRGNGDPGSHQARSPVRCVNGRPALAISALPGSRANTDW